MSKHTILTLILLTLSASLLTGQNKQNSKYDYIASGYYQLVYEADIANLEGNDSLAFAKLQEAEKRCPLINQFQYREIDLYCRLLMKNRQFDKAISYMDTLSVAYGGFPFLVMVDLEKDSVLTREFLINNPDFYDRIFPELLAKSESFYTPERDSLVQVLNTMSENDQKVRVGWENKQTFDHKKMQQTDSINLIKLLQIIEKYSFPNERLYGNKNFMLSTAISVMCAHQFDNRKLGKMLLRFVREGKYEPSSYGFFVDRKMLDKHKKFIFAIYKSTEDNKIEDIENLDKRRLSIGMPTREMENKRNELLKLSQ